MLVQNFKPITICPIGKNNLMLIIFQVKVTFDDFSAGSGTTMEDPNLEIPRPKGPEKTNKARNDTEEDLVDDNSDETLNALLKEFGASKDDVKEVKVDLDLTKP